MNPLYSQIRQQRRHLRMHARALRQGISAPKMQENTAFDGLTMAEMHDKLFEDVTELEEQSLMILSDVFDLQASLGHITLTLHHNLKKEDDAPGAEKALESFRGFLSSSRVSLAHAHSELQNYAKHGRPQFAGAVTNIFNTLASSSYETDITPEQAHIQIPEKAGRLAQNELTLGQLYLAILDTHAHYEHGLRRHSERGAEAARIANEVQSHHILHSAYRAQKWAVSTLRAALRIKPPAADSTRPAILPRPRAMNLN